jgi:hypothetical protein
MPASAEKEKAPKEPSGPSALGGAKYAAHLSARRIFRLRVYDRPLVRFKRNLDDDVDIVETPLCFDSTPPRAAPAFHSDRKCIHRRGNLEQDAIAFGAAHRFELELLVLL